MTNAFYKQVSLSPADSKGWRQSAAKVVSASAAEGHRSGSALKRVLSVVHLSDTHICDAQSPARLAFTDYLGDPHYEGPAAVAGPVGNYRPNEMLTTQVMEATIRTINDSIRSVVDGAKPDLVVITGDLVDNAQKNELSWALQLIDGGTIRPNSGSPKEYEGPGSVLLPDNFWKPNGLAAGSDELQERYGFPVVIDLLDASIASFEAVGLGLPTLLVHGNHDLMIQGTVVVTDEYRSLAVGDQTPTSFRDGVDLLAFQQGFSPFGPTRNPAVVDLNLLPVSPDSTRALVNATDWQDLTKEPTKYFARAVGGAILISLDSVNEHGGWDGSIDEVQLTWLEGVLADNRSTPAILLSHHSFFKMDNLFAPVGQSRRIGSVEFLETIERHPNVVMWLAGHDHQNRLHRIGSRNLVHVETASLIDWPQEGRLVELFEDGDEYVIICKVFSHSSPTLWATEGVLERAIDLSNLNHLAGLSREVAANHWQKRFGVYDSALSAGATTDRDFVIRIPRLQ